MVFSFLSFEKWWFHCDTEWDNIQNLPRLGEKPLSPSNHKSRVDVSFFQSGTSSQGKQWRTPPSPLMCFARQPVGWRLPSSCADPVFLDNSTSVLLWKIHATLERFNFFFFSSKLIVEYLNILSKTKEKSQICFKLQGRNIFIVSFWGSFLFLQTFDLYCFNFAFK